MPNSSGLIQIKRDLIKIGGTSLTAADWTAILKALIDDSIKGILRSIGDSGDSPANATGKTLLRILNDLYVRAKILDSNVGTQIYKTGTADNSTTIIHTVSSGKTLYLTGIALCGRVADTVSRIAELFVRDEGDVKVAILSKMSVRGNGHLSVNLILIPPYKVPAGYDICVGAYETSCYATGTIYGWEE